MILWGISRTRWANIKIEITSKVSTASVCCIEIQRRKREGGREKGGEREREERIGKRERDGGKKKKKQREAERERQVDRLRERKRENMHKHTSKQASIKIKFKDHIHYTNYHTELANQVRHEQKPPAILHKRII